MRVVMLAKGWSGYLDAGSRKLAERGVELLVVHPTTIHDTGFDPFHVDDYAQEYAWTDEPDVNSLGERVRAFGPDAVLMHGWEFKPYRTVLRSVQSRAVRILVMDNIWYGAPRQWLGRLTHRAYLDPLFDAVMLPSDRSEFFALRLGFSPDQVIRGSLTADTGLFHTEPRAGNELAARHSFLSALRLVHHKGADVLARAYREYRTLAEDPWELDVAGIGSMQDLFAGMPGVRMRGFVQPAELAELMRQTSCYVNPSRADPYAVVLHEAAACGLPILSGDFVGAAPTMIQDGYNGWVVASGRADLLAKAMARMSAQSPQRLAEMSSISRNLATRLSPTGWARNLHEEIQRRQPGASAVR